MPRKRRFIQCDVFSPVATQGNGLAVVLDGEGLSDRQMHRFATWTNLAETTFLLPPEDDLADYKVRIMTPTIEMPFAGHPTLGSCAAWLHNGGQPKQAGVVRQECNIGIVDIDLSSRHLAFVAPPTTITPLPDDDLDKIIATLDIDKGQVINSALLNNGPQWMVIELQTAEEVLAVVPSNVNWNEETFIGLIGAHSKEHDCDYEVRMLALSDRVIEDPITGSLNAAIAHWMLDQGRLTTATTVAQGTCIDRYGRVSVQPADKGKIMIGGDTHIVIEGTVNL